MVLIPLKINKLKEIFDTTSIEVIKFYIQKALFSQPEILKGQKQPSIQIPKEHIEQWVVQAIGGIPVGSGNYPIDVVKGTFGIDVKMLSCKTNENGKLTTSCSNEASLLQNFKDTGNELDTLFEQKRYTDIVDGWKNMFENKIHKAINDNNITNIYYIFILKSKDVFHICGFMVNMEYIKFVECGKTSLNNVYMKNFIDDKIGYVNIYKAKKRLELRLYPKYIVDNLYTISIQVPYKAKELELRKIIRDNKLNEYKKDVVDNIFGLV